MKPTLRTYRDESDSWQISEFLREVSLLYLPLKIRSKRPSAEVARGSD